MANLQAKIEHGNIIISFSGFKDSKDFFLMVDFIKKLPDRFFNSRNKTWEIPYHIDSANILRDKGFPVPVLEAKKKEEKKFDPVLDIPGLKKKLKPFQGIGVGFLEKTQGRGLIGDEMGLGKTLQAIAYLLLHPELRPAIIVCPASVKFVWEKEIRESTSEQKIEILSGRNGNKNLFIKQSNIVIINYDIVKDRLEELKTLNPKIIVLDESHFIKDPSTQRTKAIKALCENIPHLICLSGTPITNRPIEFFTTLNLIDPYLFPNRFKFALRYCNASKGRWGWDMNGASNTEELHRVLTRTLMIRRKKSDVLKELPPKTRTTIPLEIDNRKEYKQIETNVIKWIMENEGLEKAARATRAEYVIQIEKLKQVTARGKLRAIKEWIKDFIDTDEKLVVFCTHIEIINSLYEEFKEISVKLDGSTSQLERGDAVNRFQGDKNCKLFFGNLKAAGIGITLTAANNVAFTEYDWVPGNHLQAEDRVHRIGQQDNVTVHYLIGKDTIDEKLVGILEQKSRILGEILDGRKSEEENMFNEILEEIIKTKGE